MIDIDKSKKHSINIPEDRLGVIIGQKGSMKKELEREGHVKLKIDSKKSTVEIDETEKTESIDVYRTQLVLEAISYGFNPKVAEKLFNDDYYFVVIDLRDYSDNDKELERHKARIIGTEGKSKKKLEKLSTCNFVVYKDYVGIIGTAEAIQVGERAITMFLRGSQHSAVFEFLEKENKKLLGFYNRPADV